jgi:hypothetical protein
MDRSLPEKVDCTTIMDEFVAALSMLKLKSINDRPIVAEEDE